MFCYLLICMVSYEKSLVILIFVLIYRLHIFSLTAFKISSKIWFSCAVLCVCVCMCLFWMDFIELPGSVSLYFQYIWKFWTIFCKYFLSLPIFICELLIFCMLNYLILFQRSLIFISHFFSLCLILNTLYSYIFDSWLFLLQSLIYCYSYPIHFYFWYYAFHVCRFYLCLFLAHLC